MIFPKRVARNHQRISCSLVAFLGREIAAARRRRSQELEVISRNKSYRHVLAAAAGCIIGNVQALLIVKDGYCIHGAGSPFVIAHRSGRTWGVKPTLAVFGERAAVYC